MLKNPKLNNLIIENLKILAKDGIIVSYNFIIKQIDSMADHDGFTPNVKGIDLVWHEINHACFKCCQEVPVWEFRQEIMIDGLDEISMTNKYNK